MTPPDQPGNLSSLLTRVAELGMNVREVNHRRGDVHVPVGMTEITLELEARDHEHQQELLDRLSAEGLSVRVLSG